MGSAWRVLGSGTHTDPPYIKQSSSSNMYSILTKFGSCKWPFLAIILCSFVTLISFSLKSHGMLKISIGQQISSDQSWLEEQESRQEHLRRVCDKYGHTASRVIVTDSFYFGEKENLLCCLNYKVGTTTWRLSTFGKIANSSDFRDIHHRLSLTEDRTEAVFSKIMPLSSLKVPSSSLDQKWNPIIAFSVVRHPFERLVSAFNGVRNGEYGRMIHKMESKYGNLTFKGWVNQDVFSAAEKCAGVQKACGDQHWRPYVASCSYCDVPYTVISKMETFDQDREQILRRAGVDLPDEKTEHMNKVETYTNVNPDKLSTTDWIKKYFAELDEEDKVRLREIYKLDLELFNYDPFLYG